eukprot:6848566-Ditylum_brightwellii.AAC.1
MVDRPPPVKIGHQEDARVFVKVPITTVITHFIAIRSSIIVQMIRGAQGLTAVVSLVIGIWIGTAVMEIQIEV